MRRIWFILLCAVACRSAVFAQGSADRPRTSGNPVLPGWYADPEGAVFDDAYWIYPTTSAPFAEQTSLEAFSSPDLVTWTRHPKVLSTEHVRWIRSALWAPSVIRANGRYYLFFSANNIYEGEYGGIGVAVADTPDGPFRDLLGRPLVGEIVHGAQPIDQFVFRDDDGQYYMYYGGWRHCNAVKLSADLSRLVPFDDGSLYREVTPADYVEGPFLLKRNGKYYFMWSENDWTGPDYCVAYAIADSPLGPFVREGKILEQDDAVARGAGHHSVIKGPGDDEWYIVYHRRPLDESSAHHRATCIDRLRFDADGRILPVRMTFEGVGPRPLK